MAPRRNHPYARRPAPPAPEPVPEDDRHLGHVICAALYRDKCLCRDQGKSPCQAMHQAAADVERFLDKKTPRAPQKAACWNPQRSRWSLRWWPMSLRLHGSRAKTESPTMIENYSLKLVERCEPRETLAEEDFSGTRLAADRRLSDFWNENTPTDGSRFRATLHHKGKKAVLATISGG